jgi:hypothetical protein
VFLRAHSVWLACLLTPAILLAACAPAAGGEIQAAPGQECILAPGQTAVIIGEELLLTFEAVTADSRCPQGVTCVWAGEAKCQMTISSKGTRSGTVFTVKGGSDGYSESVFGGYRASFNLQPYPMAGQKLPDRNYRLLLKIVKAS